MAYFVVSGADAGSKLNQARELGVTVYDEQFLALLKSPQPQPSVSLSIVTAL